MGAGSPLPFEGSHGRLWARVSATLRLAWSSPMAAYLALRKGRSLAAPWRLKILLSAPAYLAAILLLLLGQAAVMAIAWTRPVPMPPQAFQVCPALLLLLLTGGPLLQGASMLAGGATLHALLWVLGGTRRGAGLRQTLRAAGYTQALVGLAAQVPLLGLSAYPASRNLLGRGLARLHRTDPWRGLAAAWIQAALTFAAAAALVLAGALGFARMDERSREIVMPGEELAPLPETPAPDLIRF